jgi:LAO/AO transport system kinase
MVSGMSEANNSSGKRVWAELEKFLPLIDQGDHRALAKALSIVEDLDISLSELENTFGEAREVAILGITGSPGVGKSTTTGALITHLRTLGQKVGVIAIDPSSVLTGGALLGDRIRLVQHFTDRNVFIRSLATRGALGGLSRACDSAAYLMKRAGFDSIILETVGVGQSEVDVMRHADTVLIVLAPGMGDGVQIAKAGVMEIGDIYFVNKADRGGAEDLAREIEKSIALSPPKLISGKTWQRPVLIGEMERSVGVSELWTVISEHQMLRE